MVGSEKNLFSHIIINSFECTLQICHHLFSIQKLSDFMVFSRMTCNDVVFNLAKMIEKLAVECYEAVCEHAEHVPRCIK